MRDFRRSRLAVDAAASAVCALLDGGRILLFDGERPGPDELSDQSPLAELRFDSPAFLPPLGGRAGARPLADSLVHRYGRPTWFRAETAGGEAVFDGTVGPTADPGEEGHDLELDSVAVDLDDAVRVELMTYAEPQREPELRAR